MCLATLRSEAAVPITRLIAGRPLPSLVAVRAEIPGHPDRKVPCPFMRQLFVPASELGTEKALPLHAVLQREVNVLLERLGANEAAWLRAIRFSGKEGELALLPGDAGALAGAVLGLGIGRDPHALALFSERLPSGIYRLMSVPEGFGGSRALYAWAIGAYRFDRYRQRAGKPSKEQPRLIVPD